MPDRRCEVCGAAGARPDCVRYRSDDGRWHFEGMARCEDREACRRTCERAGAEYFPIDRLAEAARDA